MYIRREDVLIIPENELHSFSGFSNKSFEIKIDKFKIHETFSVDLFDFFYYKEKYSKKYPYFFLVSSLPTFFVKKWDSAKFWNLILNEIESVLPLEFNTLEEVNTFLFNLEPIMALYFTDWHDLYWPIDPNANPELLINGEEIVCKPIYAYEGNGNRYNSQNKIEDLQKYRPQKDKDWELYVCYELTFPNNETREFYITYTSCSKIIEYYEGYFNNNEDEIVKTYKHSIAATYSYNILVEHLDNIAALLDSSSSVKQGMKRIGHFFDVL